MAIYVTGDTHGELDMSKLLPRRWREGQSLSRDDYLIILGDFGLVWSGSPSERRSLDQLEGMPWTTLFIDGNHENHRMLAEDFDEVDFCGGRAHRVREHVLHLMRGHVFDLDVGDGTTKSFAVMGGARSIDKMWRREGVSWWQEEIPSQTERDLLEESLATRSWSVDYVLTHDAPSDLVPKLALVCQIEGCRADEFERWLNSIAYRLDYRHWYFGHWHADCDLTPMHTVLYHEIRPLGDEDERSESDE